MIDGLQDLVISDSKPNSALDALTLNNLGQLQIIQKYSFEKEASKDEVSNWMNCSAQLVYFNDISVGGIVWKHSGDSLIIQLLAILPAYRRHSLGRSLIDHIVKTAKEFKPTVLEQKPLFISSHCPELAWPFFKQAGFQKVDGKIIEGDGWVDRGFKVQLTII